MQPLGWYYKRLAKMSFEEVVWRCQTLLKQLLARIRYQIHGSLVGNTDFLQGLAFKPVKSLGLIVVPQGKQPGSAMQADWQAYLAIAQDAIKHRLSFFDLLSQDCGNPIRWQYDFSNRVECQRGLSLGIDYRDLRLNGDCKYVWEPNRHQHLLAMAVAFRLTEDEAYRRAIAQQLLSWIEDNPFAHGMNWRSPLELGIRLINWVYVFDVVDMTLVLSPDEQARVLQSVYLHIEEITSHYSRGSSANNHLVGEAAGVFIAASYFEQLPDSVAWAEQAQAILEREILQQSYADGCSKEHALGYQFFVLQFYLYCGIVGRRSGRAFSPTYIDRLTSMVDFVAALARAGEPPMYGDKDDGYVLNLGDDPYAIQPYYDLLGILRAGQHGQAELKSVASLTGWLVSGLPYQAVAMQGEKPLQSQHFAESGYCLLEYGDQASGVSVFVDLAPLGYGPIAAHGNADALSVVVRVDGQALLIDTGTYDYFSHPQWRNYFRSTAAHNTLVVDGVDQSEMTGPFMWDKRAEVEVDVVSLTPPQQRVVASHNGYSRLSDAVTHRREIELIGQVSDDQSQASDQDSASQPSRKLIIIDKLDCQSSHRVELYFHFSEQCRLEQLEDHCFMVHLAGKRHRLWFDSALSCEVVKPSDTPGPGWRSPSYHRKIEIPVLRLHGKINGATQFVTRFLFE